MTFRTLLTDLIKEIDAVTEVVEPAEKLRPTDTVYSTDCPEDIKKLWTLRQKYGMDAVKMELTAMFTPPKDQNISQDREIVFKATVLTELLWQTLSLQFPADKRAVIGLRKGWVMVNPAPKNDPLVFDDEPKIGVVN